MWHGRMAGRVHTSQFVHRLDTQPNARIDSLNQTVSERKRKQKIKTDELKYTFFNENELNSFFHSAFELNVCVLDLIGWPWPTCTSISPWIFWFGNFQKVRDNNNRRV